MKKQSCFYLVAMFALANVAVAQSGFQLTRQTVIGGEGGWDYLSVDDQNRKLYVSHSTQVEVLNVDTHEKEGTIANLKGVHGAIAVPKAGRGITTNGRSNSVTIFDLKTLETVVELPVGKNPDALLYDKFSERVFIFNHSDVTASAIDINQGKVIGTVDLGGSALEAGVSDEHGTIFVNLEDTHEIVSFDPKTLIVKNKWKLTPGEGPTGLAIDIKNHRLFSVCSNGWMMVLDSQTGKLIKQVPIGNHVDGVVFDPKTEMIISSNGEGTMTVVKEISSNEYKVLETVTTKPGARTIALDPKTHHVFLSTAQYEVVAVSAANPNPRPKIVPGTFMVLEYGIK